MEFELSWRRYIDQQIYPGIEKCFEENRSREQLAEGQLMELGRSGPASVGGKSYSET